MEEACILRVNAWIKEIKRKAYETNINTQDSNTNENPDELLAYKSDLEELEQKLRKAITDENTEALSELHWPNDLNDCIKNMSLRTYILDNLHQAFNVHHFNKSPEHERELQKDSQW
jgi:hypothetical protein